MKGQGFPRGAHPWAVCSMLFDFHVSEVHAFPLGFAIIEAGRGHGGPRLGGFSLRS